MPDTLTKSQLPPALEGGWPVGSILLFTKDPLAFFDEYVPKYDGIFQVTSIFFKPVAGIKYLMMVSKPDYIKHILQENNRSYRKSFGYEVLRLICIADSIQIVSC